MIQTTQTLAVLNSVLVGFLQYKFFSLELCVQDSFQRL